MTTAPSVARGLAPREESMAMMGWYGTGMGGMGWLGMGLFWLVLLGVVLWAVVRLLPAGGSKGRERGEHSPVEILDRRFARGEVDIETYQAQRAALVSAGAR